MPLSLRLKCVPHLLSEIPPWEEAKSWTRGKREEQGLRLVGVAGMAAVAQDSGDRAREQVWALEASTFRHHRAAGMGTGQSRQEVHIE